MTADAFAFLHVDCNTALRVRDAQSKDPEVASFAMQRQGVLPDGLSPEPHCSGPADQDIDPELVVETASARQSMLAQVFQRERPDAAWLQRAVSGFSRVPSASLGISPAGLGRPQCGSTSTVRRVRSDSAQNDKL